MKISFEYTEKNNGNMVEKKIFGNVDAFYIKKTIMPSDFIVSELMFDVAGNEYKINSMRSIKIIFSKDIWRLITKTNNYYESVDGCFDTEEKFYEYLKEMEENN